MTGLDRLARLEQVTYLLDDAMQKVIRELQITKSGASIVGKKNDSLISLLSKGVPISLEVVLADVEAGFIQESINFLQERKDAGILVDTNEIEKDSLIVARELKMETGEVTRSRLQFPWSAVADGKIAADLLGKKVGDILKFSDNVFENEILEIYKIVEVSLAAQDKVEVKE